MSELCLPATRGDQAAGLRRLFGRRGGRLLPVIVPDLRSTKRGLAIAQLARAFAAAGERTLVLDAGRQNLAHELGQRARFDLFHALSGERALTDVLLPAAPNLRVAPAARAVEQALALRVGLASALSHASGGADLVVLVVDLARAQTLRGEAILLIGPNPAEAASAFKALSLWAKLLDRPALRLVFADTDEAAARTLYQRWVESAGLAACKDLRWGGVLDGPAEAAHLATLASEWALGTLRSRA